MTTSVPAPRTGGQGQAEDGPPAITIAHVSKSFRMPRERAQTLKQRVLHPRLTSRTELLRAVDDVSIEIPQGEFHGIVGRNGSGKSTLLKCIAGIYATDAGRIDVSGRLSPFIELGVGFNPELTARDNVIINAIMLGLSRPQAEARFEQIMAFAELEEFVDLKLKNYSSGMHVRLAFAVAIQVDADVLLIDEVLAVGDAAFQEKCYGEFTRLKREGRTIVFVTHDMGAVKRFCDRATLLERGRVVATGEPGSIAHRYNDLNYSLVRQEARQSNGPAVLRRAPVAEILDAGLETPAGEPLVSARQGEVCCVRARIRFHAAAENPIFAVALQDESGQFTFATNSALALGRSGRFEAGEMVVVHCEFDNWLTPGRHRLIVSITSEDNLAANAYDLREDIASLIVYSDGGGAMDLPHRFTIDRD